jgi:cell division protease FtsH
VDEGYATAKSILIEKREDLDRLAQGLLEYETLTGKDITRVIDGQPLNRDDDDGGGQAEPGPSGIAAIPKTGKGPRAARGGDGMEPEPAT